MDGAYWGTYLDLDVCSLLDGDSALDGDGDSFLDVGTDGDLSLDLDLDADRLELRLGFM